VAAVAATAVVAVDTTVQAGEEEAEDRVAGAAMEAVVAVFLLLAVVEVLIAMEVAEEEVRTFA
jgi:hypothetical protein